MYKPFCCLNPDVDKQCFNTTLSVSKWSGEMFWTNCKHLLLQWTYLVEQREVPCRYSVFPRDKHSSSCSCCHGNKGLSHQQPHSAVQMASSAEDCYTAPVFVPSTHLHHQILISWSQHTDKHTYFYLQNIVIVHARGGWILYLAFILITDILDAQLLHYPYLVVFILWPCEAYCYL